MKIDSKPIFMRPLPGPNTLLYQSEKSIFSAYMEYIHMHACIHAHLHLTEPSNFYFKWKNVCYKNVHINYHLHSFSWLKYTDILIFIHLSHT